ncbi:hypothetical protein [Vibrio sp. HN007]|uniref:hypothetical protein n=1 Tax=Vibrio iocasae TaxID=3098914 RepID=UPI0035D48003
MPFRAEYNCCKSYGCPNCGKPELSLYSRSDRLGYDSWHCPLCGAYPPVLFNTPILALSEQIYLEKSSALKMPACHCQSPYWMLNGKTSGGSQRIKCKTCKLSATLPNANRLSQNLQPLMDALVEGVMPQQLQEYCNLENKRFGQLVSQLSQILDCVSWYWEAGQQFTSIETRSYVQSCRSGYRHLDRKHQSAHAWTLITADTTTGYVILISDNALFDTSKLATEVEKQSLYQMPQREVGYEQTSDVLQKAKFTYDKILNRSQFDQLAYCSSLHSKLRDALLLRPVYAAHSHMQNLHTSLLYRPPSHMFLEHESLLRGATITAFSEEVKAGKTDLYYLHTTKRSNADRVQHQSKKSEKVISWWSERWQRLEFESESGKWDVGIGYLTETDSDAPNPVAQFSNSHPGMVSAFWEQYGFWLPQGYAERLSISRVHMWQNIYRYLYNMVFADIPRIELPKELSPGKIKSLIDYINQAQLQSH